MPIWGPFSSLTEGAQVKKSTVSKKKFQEATFLWLSLT